MNKKFLNGFTLIEVVLSMAIVVLIFGIAAPVYQDYQIRNGMDTGVNTIVENLRRAQVLSMAVDGDSNWGVIILNNQITLFKGINFATRDTAFDEVSDILSIISPSGLDEIVFSKLNGLPNTTGVINLSASSNTRTITINEKGILTY
ncbi:MAG: prepilin-type N-terminal cleavage/methylation domain-containing protein [Candidatus Paceibacterota bacterium]|jgi:prepilin-type N-terminal cleavage/methylation domain-containing protein